MIGQKAGRRGQGKAAASGWGRDPAVLFGLDGIDLFGGRELGLGHRLGRIWRRLRRRRAQLNLSGLTSHSTQFAPNRLVWAGSVWLV